MQRLRLGFPVRHYIVLRKMLVENSLVAVVSLPAGCFNPYSGVKTSILLLDKSLARQSDTIGFFKVEADGFGLGAQRRAIEKNDLPQVQAELAAYLHALRSKSSIESILALTSTAQIVPKEKIATDGDYNLSGERYREGITQHSIYPRVLLEEIAEVRMGETLIKGDLTGKGKPIFSADSSDEPWAFSEPTRLSFGKNTLVIGARGTIGSVKFPNLECFTCTQTTIAITAAVERILPEFLYHWLKAFDFKTITEGVGIPMITVANVNKFEIPLPPLEVQKEIVAEIEDYQKVINGARAVLDHYRPHIPIHPDWPMVELEEFTESDWGNTNLTKSAYVENGPYLGVSAAGGDGRMDHAEHKVGTLVLSAIGANCGRMFFPKEDFTAIKNTMTIKPHPDKADPLYLHTMLSLSTFPRRGGGQPFIAKGDVLKHQIPLPPLATQQAIVAEIEAEQALVVANRELITRFEQKIQATLARIWGAPETP